MPNHSQLNRRGFIAAAGATAALPAVAANAHADTKAESATIRPAGERHILLSCKLGMIAKKDKGKDLTLVERLTMAGEAGFDGVDFDEAGSFTEQEARDAVHESGVFVHNAIDHTHWSKRLTSAKEEERETAKANIEHCIRVSHAAGGNGVLIVVGRGGDGSEEETIARCSDCLLYTSPSPRDATLSRMPSSA